MRMGFEHNMPQYVDLIHPELKPQKLTKEQIIQRTLELLR